jgi:endonuclease/exonuclease/phosphatase family metal-dependent hydrolase
MKRMLYRFVFLFSIAILYGFASFHYPREEESFMIVSYNVENLFDTIDNPLTADDEFTPQGTRHWTSYRYYRKLKMLWKVLAATSLTDFPDIVGVYEVENRAVLSDLVSKTPLRLAHYSIFHRESCDRRGIDVAILYRDEKFLPIDSAAVRIVFDTDTSYHSRDIMYLKGVVKKSNDTLHIFANHWPSRYGGWAETEKLRCTAAKVLRRCVDSILRNEPSAKILCIGDFNDNPYNKSVTECLDAVTDLDSEISEANIYNISYYLAGKKGLWTYWYGGKGDFLDQVFVSGALLKERGLHLSTSDVYPLSEKFLLNDNGTVYRTYLGPRYVGGYSDHLPVVIKMHYGIN